MTAPSQLPPSPSEMDALITPPNDTAVLGLLCGFGQLPVSVVQYAKSLGWRVVAFPIHRDNRAALKSVADAVEPVSPGLLEKNLTLARKHGITHVVMAGKVNKWLLFCNPKLDGRAVAALNQVRSRSDEQFMLAAIELIEAEGLTVLPQTAFLQDHFMPVGHLAGPKLTDAGWHDAQYGCQLAKAVASADIGQTVVVHHGMVLAVEAIEGTDECLKRAGQWARKKGGTVVKVAKATQDARFDVPTVGLKTLKAMRRAGLTTLIAESGQTFFLDPEAMRAYAEKHGITLVSVNVDAVRNGGRL